MTIAERNRTRLIIVFLMGIILLVSAFVFFSILTSDRSILVDGLSQKIQKETAQNSLITIFLAKIPLTKYNIVVALTSILFCPIFAFFLLLYTYFTFKKTQAIEISFFVFYLFSIGFEAVRLISPYYSFSNYVFESMTYISRIVYFFRLAGFISLFIGSIFALKIITRQIFYTMFFIAFISFSMVSSVPINNFAINQYFISDIEFTYSYMLIALAFILLACFNYIFAAFTKNSKEYIFVAATLFSFTLGQIILLTAGSLFKLIIGSGMFLTSCVFYLKDIHRYHLWD